MCIRDSVGVAGLDLLLDDGEPVLLGSVLGAVGAVGAVLAVLVDDAETSGRGSAAGSVRGCGLRVVGSATGSLVDVRVDVLTVLPGAGAPGGRRPNRRNSDTAPPGMNKMTPTIATP